MNVAIFVGVNEGRPVGFFSSEAVFFPISTWSIIGLYRVENRRLLVLIPVTASTMGHPWNLWGLSLLFDGSDPSKTKVVATKPEGQPTFDPNNEAERNQFRANGYDILTSLTSDELVWDDGKDRVDLRDLRPIADDLLLRVNGLARTFDPTFTPVRLIHLTFPNGAMATGDWTPNRDSTYLGAAGQHDTTHRALPLAGSNPDVKFVLEAMVLPATWASLYLVIDAIKTSVGGRHKLDNLGWLIEQWDRAQDARNWRYCP
ncbi:hypothetical protein [Bradyrhizobium sp. SZCCHNR2032]|uniref:hypothetical protein n=1 Tax=Bradyrhizobium sp. SZCCHNR2032 TaxID=3057384 RepID=UPI0029170B1A|nr:hypothetical protein [Bradyrhizobium sp. SZCCHNR2032]